METLKQEDILSFQNYILEFYQTEGRSFAWRTTDNPYHILVSEIMLQQTQTERVLPKYHHFLETLPSIYDLAHASLWDLLALWQGLGYNRRALALQKTAQIIVSTHQGIVPNCEETLKTFPGIGAYTAGAICTFAFHKPTVFIETNIRSVFIHFFFKQHEKVHDKKIMPLIEQTLYTENPRLWYYALMDYGALLKKKLKNLNAQSIHYATQSKFQGSDRQIRGAIIRLLTQQQIASEEDILMHLKKEPERAQKILAQLCNEGFIKQEKNIFFIPK